MKGRNGGRLAWWLKFHFVAQVFARRWEKSDFGFGIIITTSDFSIGAREEAMRADAAPVGLMNGQQFIDLPLEHEIGVQKTSLDLFEIKPNHQSGGHAASQPLTC